MAARDHHPTHTDCALPRTRKDSTMRLFAFTILSAVLASMMGCANCGTAPGCCSAPATCCDSGCYPIEQSCGVLGCDTCCESTCDVCTVATCDACDTYCDSGYVVYDGPTANLSKALAQPGCAAHACTSAANATGIPTIAAPANSQNPPQPQAKSVVHRDEKPAAPSPDSIIKPPAAPVPLPSKQSPTKPVKNFLPSILSDDT